VCAYNVLCRSRDCTFFFCFGRSNAIVNVIILLVSDRVCYNIIMARIIIIALCVSAYITSFRLIILLLRQLVPEGKLVIFPEICIEVHNFKQFFYRNTYNVYYNRTVNQARSPSFFLYRFLILSLRVYYPRECFNNYWKNYSIEISIERIDVFKKKLLILVWTLLVYYTTTYKLEISRIRKYGL